MFTLVVAQRVVIGVDRVGGELDRVRSIIVKSV